MPTGIESPPDKLAEFRAHYLYSGNASEAAREAGISERTGRDIAKRLLDDETFAEDRRRLRAQALEELVAMRMRVARKALERFEGHMDSEDFASSGDNVTIIDKRPDYGRLINDAERNAHNLAKIDAANAANETPIGDVEIVIRRAGNVDEDNG